MKKYEKYLQNKLLTIKMKIHSLNNIKIFIIISPTFIWIKQWKREKIIFLIRF